MVEKLIILSRGQNKGSVTRIYNFCLDETLIEKSTVDQIVVKKDRLISSFKEYTDLNVEIMAFDTEDGEDIEEIEERYEYALAKLNGLLRTKSLATLGASCSGSERVEQNYQRLPRIEIPKFNGQVGDYYSFQNMFTSVIDSDNRLSPCEKFYYLRSLLQGEALDVIKHLVLDATNYPVALKLLADRYNNKVKIMNYHITSLLDVKHIQKRILEKREERRFCDSNIMDFLLGWDIMFQILLREQISVIPGRLFLQNAQFGYVVAGRVSRSSDRLSHPTSNLYKVFHDESQSSNLYTEANSEHELAEQNFTDSVVLNNGKFQVSLPLKQEFEKITLGDSLSCALQRFYNLENIEHKHYNETINLPEELPELKTCNVSIKNEQLHFFTKYSDINKMKRILAYVYRFYNNCLSKKVDRRLGHLTCSELEFASSIIIKNEQEKYLAKEIEALQSRQSIKSNLRSFNPFLDKIGILRVGGRLHHADIPYSQKHPIILPKGSRITHLIILNEHRLLLHAGQKLILSSLNQKYYIINGLREVKHVIHKCITCFKLKAKTAEQLMGSLPPDRVNPSRVFHKVGVDFGGPFYIKLHRVRKPLIYKAYIVLFVCFITKAIHIELASNMTTECFLNCLKRFIARRNKPSIIYCDNASTFKGANNQLNELYLLQSNKDHKNAVQTLASKLGIEFSFIPSYSPVFGGLWEAGIKSAKYHLKRVVGTSVLTYEELNTVVIKIEGVLNSRPLIALPSSDPDMSYSYLTPGHFLTGASLSTYPEPDFTNSNINRLAFWNQCKHMVQHFWKLWHKQYLVQLQNRPKWRKDLPNIQKGTLVLMKEDNVPPLKWPMARVVEVFPGRDGKVRALSVKTSRGFIIRTSVTKICVLPMENVS